MYGSQNVIPSKKYFGGYLPYVFTEQGIANLASVLNNDKAIQINIQIMITFVSMRKFLSKNNGLFQRLNKHDKKFIEYDKKFEKIFNIIDLEKSKRGIFFDGSYSMGHFNNQYIISGRTDSFGENAPNIWTIKIDKRGKLFGIEVTILENLIKLIQ